MPGLHVSPRGMDPLKPVPSNGVSTGTMADHQPHEEGFVYGKAPKPPNERPPDIEAMMEAAGLPGPTEGGLPFTLEWYRGAKARQAKRDIEKEELLNRKNDLRKGWASQMLGSLDECAGQVDKIIGEPQPLGKLAEMLARTNHERPDQIARIQELKGRLVDADRERVRLNNNLQGAKESMGSNQDAIRRRDSEGDLDEEERIRQKILAAKKKAKGERALRRNEALLRGEDPGPPTPPSEEEQECASPVPDVTNRALSSPPLPPEPPQAGAVRSGPARELPPISHPPRPPTPPT